MSTTAKNNINPPGMRVDRESVLSTKSVSVYVAMIHTPTFTDDFSSCSSYSDWVAFITNKTPTEHCLYSKCAHTFFNWYIRASHIGVVGGSWAAATV